MLQPLSHIDNFEDFLLARNIDCHVSGDGISQHGGASDFGDCTEGFGLDFFVQFYIFVEFADDRTEHGFGFGRVDDFFFEHLRVDFVEFGVFFVAQHFGALYAFDQHFDGAIGQAQELQHRGNSADFINICGHRLVLRAVFLASEQNFIVAFDHALECFNGFIAPDK